MIRSPRSPRLLERPRLLLLCLCLATNLLLAACGGDEPRVPTFDVRYGDVGSSDIDDEAVDAAEEETIDSRCSDHSDCGSEELCVDSRCVDRDDALSSCAVDEDCPDEFHCVDEDHCEED